MIKQSKPAKRLLKKDVPYVHVQIISARAEVCPDPR